jgi:hypothetical protein
MKKYRLCIALAILVGIISSCSVIPASNGPTAINDTPIPTVSYIHPSEFPTVSPSESPSVSPTSSIQPSATVDSVMINEQNNFKFGMSRKSVDKELKKLGITITDESSTSEAPDGFYTISTNNMEFDFNNQNQLYSITVYDGETANGLKSEDSVERIQQVYGKPDQLKHDINSNSYTYIYDCNGYMFSVYTSHDTIVGWSVFLNIWNDPNSYGITNVMYKGDDSIQFNEDNFDNYFTFGMNLKDVKKILTGLGVRIDSEELDQADDNSFWSIETDHISFGFSKKQRLESIDVSGWGTAKGLQIGDSVEKLHQLYEQENRIIGGDRVSDYIYNKKGYLFDVEFLKNDSGVLGLDSWSIYTR